MGYLVVALIVIGSAIAAIPAINYTSPMTAISLEAAMCAFLLMSISLLMATRIKVLEYLFGGLDRLYVAHRRIGYLILVLILVHYIYTPNFTGLFQNKELNELAKLTGYYTFFALCALIVFSIVKKIPFLKFQFPYHIWYATHRFIGFAFLAIAFHQFFVKKPFDQTETIAYILNFASLVGIVSYAYTQSISHFKKKSYRIVAVEKHAAATVITAVPTGRRLKLRAGQFIIAHIRRRGLREPHPFTVSRIAADGSLTISVKPLGDYTRRLRENLHAGDILRVEGGYGHFHFGRGGAQQIWIAGGIGVTPFAAMAADLQQYPQISVTMIYCVRDVGEAIYQDLFRALDEKLENFRFILHASNDSGRLDAEKLKELAHVKPGQADFWFCGPAPLRQALVRGLAKIGEKPRRIRFEQFEFR
ncbi:MAG: FAD-binding domain protein [Rhizobium sp.]|nr:FAD-binding domain protein [Rhizobium sp.]